MANYVKFKQGLKKDFNTTNQPLTNGMIYFVIDENNNGSIYYDTIVDGKKATKNGTVNRVKFSGLPIKITGSVIGTGVISQDGETIEINTSTNHSHGLVHQNFNVTLSDDDTNLKWTRLGNQNSGFWLKSIRGKSKAPAWFLPYFSAGIAFGGADTKGVISVKYSRPGVRFAGGTGDAPVWYFTITGANDKTYDLSQIGGHSSDSEKLDHNVTFKIASTADATKGGSGTATNLSGSAVDLYLPTKISGFDLLQATRFQGNADTSTVAAKLGRGGNTSLPMTFNWNGQGGQPTWLWGGENGTDMYVYNPSNFRVAHSVNTAGLDHNITFKISKVANATTGETGITTKLTGALLELILPASISGFNLIQSTRFQGNADSATVASRANSLFLNPSNRQENIDYQINSDQYQSRVTYSLASSITKTGKPPVGDSHVLTFGWDNSGCGAQLAITADAKPHMAIRGAKVGEKGISIWDKTWSTVLDSSNYTSYINNYYWADVKVSTTANAKTNPNFFNVTSSGWFFSNAPSTGWQNSALGGGIYMKDSSYVRIYGGKKFAVENTDSDSINTTGGVKASGGFTSDSGAMKIYAEFNNEINFGGTNESNTVYFGCRKKDSKEIPSIFIFGSDTGTANIQANAGWFGQKYLSGDNWIGWYTKKGDTSSKRYGYIKTDISDNGNMRFVKEGGGYFTFNSHVNPNQTNAYDLGTQALAWRTLYVTNLNLYGQTANRLVWTNGANAIQASHHYASSTQVSIGDTSPVEGCTFYVKGDSLFQGNIRVANDNTTNERFVDVYNSTGHIYLDAMNGRMGIWTNIGGVSTWLISTTKSNAEIPRLLQISSNGNTITIGSQSSNGCHLYNSANIPFIFNKTVASTDGNLGTIGYPWHEVYSNNWFRSIGTGGWRSETYGGGWHMTDSTYIRNYGGKTTRLDNLCLGADNNSYRLYVKGTSYFTDYIRIPKNKSLIQDQESTSNYSSIIEWRKGGGAGQSSFTYNPQVGQHNIGGADGSGSICVLPYATSTDPWGGTVGLFITKNKLILDNCRVPTTGNTSGNIGSASQPIYVNNGIITAITGSIANDTTGKAAGLSYYSIDNNLTVAQAKDQIRSKLTNKGIAAAVLSSSYINQWNTNTASYYKNTVHSMIALNPGYDNTRYGHFLVAHYGNGDLRHVGIDEGNWGSLRTLLDSVNYTSYTVTKTGSGASGTWNININGNATTAIDADTTDGVHLEWADTQAASATDWIAGWSADGKKIKAVKRSDLETKNADTVDGYHADAFVKKAGDTMTGPLYTSFKSSVAIGSYEAVATTVQDLVNNVRYSSGCMGSVNLTTTYSATGGTILAGWYNFIYSPHRSGGRNGTAVGDNCDYGTLLLTGMTVGSAHWRIRVSSGSITEVRRIWNAGDSVTGAVWNDYAECRQSDCSEPGRVVFEKGDDTLTKTEKRLQHFAGVISDTWGFSQGETDKAKINIAVAGRVLVYTYQDRNNYKPGDCVCAAPNGTIDIMTREEIIKFPDRIVGIVSCVPDYEEWGGGKNADRDPVKVNGRIWIKVK